ncbi:MAG: FAD-dependent oxidoreductase [Chloroflexi bacterium]|nr:FAD-dependent oxidoreductase [Chloroflexota bacterium]
MIQRFEKLLSPGTIGTMKTRNKIVMPPMHTDYATHEGIVTRQITDYYAARARGGVGLIIVESTLVHPSGKHNPQELGIYDDKCTRGLGDLVEAVKGWGSRIAIQLNHAGRQARTEFTGMPVVAPSAIPCLATGGLPRELTLDEIVELVEAYAQAARRAKQAGFDAVEIHGAHGYLVSQFLSPHTNRRTDKYGGNISGRLTFLLEVIKRTRELVGSDFPILVRINAEDFQENGFTFDDCKQAAHKLEAAGVNGLDISANTHESRLNPRVTTDHSSMYEPRGQMVSRAEQIRKNVSLPVIAVGAITPEMGEEILRQERADFIAIGRGLVADPELVNKLARGEPEEIRPCIRCQETHGKEARGMRCTVNAECGFESREMTPPLRRKKVMIVGGGPAGMEAARVSALRGHDVTLYEKDNRLGGHLLEATVPDFKADLGNYMAWLIRQIEKLGVKVELAKEVTSKMVENARPDALVLATGSITSYPDIPGINKPIVTTATEILLGKTIPGKKTLVVGGGAIGCEVALHLAQNGNNTTIVARHEIASDLPLGIGRVLRAKVVDAGVEILTNLKVVSVTDSGVTAVNLDRDLVNVEGDKVVLAAGLVPQAGLYDELKDKVHEIYLVGDCIEPRRVRQATREGYRVGCAI